MSALRQEAVLRMYCDDYYKGISGEESKERIAERLHLALRTVRNHIYDGYKRLGIHSRKELKLALAGAIKWGFPQSSALKFKEGDVVWYGDGFKTILGPRTDARVIGLDLVDSDLYGKVRTNGARFFVTDFRQIVPLETALRCGADDLYDE